MSVERVLQLYKPACLAGKSEQRFMQRRRKLIEAIVSLSKTPAARGSSRSVIGVEAAIKQLEERRISKKWTLSKLQEVLHEESKRG